MTTWDDPRLEAALQAMPEERSVLYRSTRQPQPWSEASTWWDLPTRIVRGCCPGSTCGDQVLLLERTSLGHVMLFGYVRESNGDLHSPVMSTVAEANKFLNDIERWPSLVTAVTEDSLNGHD